MAIVTLFIVSIIVAIFYAVFLYVFYYPYSIYHTFRKQGIPGRWIPLVGDLLALRESVKKERPFEWSYKQFEKYGKEYFVGSFGTFTRLVIADPSLMQYVLVKNADSYHKTPLMRQSLGGLLGLRNLLLSEDMTHAMHRKAISPCFHYQNLQSMQTIMVDTVNECLDEWETHIAASSPMNQATNNSSVSTSNGDPGDSYTLDMQPAFSGLTLDIVSRCVFGSNLSTDAKRVVYKFLTVTLENQSRRLMNMTGILPILRSLPLPSKNAIKRSSLETRQIVQQLIQERREGKSKRKTENADLLDLLLQATIHDKITGRELHFSNEEIFEHCVTFILAGHETTSNLLTWCIYYLTQHPEYLRKGQAEVDAVLKGKAPTSSQLQNLPYIEAILLETLRISGPVANIVRQATRENEIVASDGKRIRIAAGSGVLLNFYRLHHNPKYWPEPFTFKPSRWVDDADYSGLEKEKGKDGESSRGATKDDYKSDVTEVTKRKRIQPYTLLGFSAGPRSCIGQNFAMIEGKTILAMLLQRFDLTLEPGQKVVPSVAVTIKPKYGLKVRITKRKIPL